MIRKINLKFILLLSLVFIISLTSCKKDEMLNKYQNLKDEQHIFEVVDEYKIIELLDSNEKAIIVFSFPECPPDTAPCALEAERDMIVNLPAPESQSSRMLFQVCSINCKVLLDSLAYVERFESCGACPFSVSRIVFLELCDEFLLGEGLAQASSGAVEENSIMEVVSSHVTVSYGCVNVGPLVV